MRRPIITAIATTVALVAFAAPAGATPVRRAQSHQFQSHQFQSHRSQATDTTFAVGRASLTFVDSSRATDSNNTYAGAPNRTLPVIVLYPAKGAPGTVTDNAKPSRRHGPYPLFEFSHGFTANGPAYEQALLAQIASHGYVVAAPTFPLSSGGAPGGPKLVDYLNQPADVSFVITQMLRANRHDGPLEGLIDKHEIGVGGHSLGAITTFGMTANDCCLDARIDAAIPISGIELPFGTGGWTYPKLPRLYIHGDHDGTVPYVGSTTAFAKAPAPKFLLTLINAPHTPFVPPWKTPVIDTAVAFLDRYLKHDHHALARMTTAGNLDGVAHLDAVRH